MIDRRRFLADTASLAASLVLLPREPSTAKPHAESQNAKRPNLLFIQPDQFRLHSLGIWRMPEFRNVLGGVSDPVHTPVLDKLASESVLFTRACATAPVCSPSRAMLMSGMYPGRNGVFANCMKGSPDGMRDDAICITDVLADSGYETALVGKAHWERTLPLFDADGNYVGTQRPPGGHYVNPFDTYVPPGGGRHSNKLWFQTIRDVHYDPLVYSSAPALAGGKRDGEVYHAKGFSSVIEADVAIDFLRNKNGERDPQKPFSLMWNTVPPHTPYSSLKDCEEDIYSKYYKDMPLRELLVRPNIDIPKAGREGNLELSARIYFSLVSSVDRQVGRVLQALEQSGEADNTIVIFTSDHGEMMGSHGLFAKSVIYDESFLIPLMIRFPKKLRPRTEDLMISRVDLMPTILGLAGLESKIPRSVQGVDYSGGLLSQRFVTHKKPKSAVYLMENGRGVRTDRYTYFVGKDGSTQLYDNTNDPYQQKNLPRNAVDSSDLRGLQEELGRWLRDATDSWYQDRSHSDLISYPAGLEHPTGDRDVILQWSSTNIPTSEGIGKIDGGESDSKGELPRNTV